MFANQMIGLCKGLDVDSGTCEVLCLTLYIYDMPVANDNYLCSDQKEFENSLFSTLVKCNDGSIQKLLSFE